MRVRPPVAITTALAVIVTGVPAAVSSATAPATSPSSTTRSVTSKLLTRRIAPRCPTWRRRVAAAADEALVDQQDLFGAGARRRNRGIHASAPGPDDQHIGRKIGHAGDLVPQARIATIGTAKPSAVRYRAAVRTIAASIAGRA